jgi:hypothetical protein
MNRFASIRNFLKLPIIQAPALQFTGAIADPESLARETNAVILNGQSVAGSFPI